MHCIDIANAFAQFLRACVYGSVFVPIGRLCRWFFCDYICSQCKSMQDKVVKRSQVRHTFAPNEAELHVCIHAFSFFSIFVFAGKTLVIVFYTALNRMCRLFLLGPVFILQQLTLTLIGTMKANIYWFQRFLQNCVIQFVEILWKKK